MGKAEALVGALLTGLLLSWMLMVWGTWDRLEYERVVRASQQEPPAPDPHEGQVDHCTNARGAPKAHLCECKKEPNEDGTGCDIEDKKCKVYCRKQHCHCYQPACDS